MALIVEDGTGVAGANGLITVAFADSYFADRAVAAWTGAVGQKEVAIVLATDYMELMNSNRWNGYLHSDATTLSFPRQSMYDRKGYIVDFAADGIPIEIQKACAEYAVRALNASLLPDPTVEAGGKVTTFTKRKIGPIETENEFMAGYQQILRKYPVPDRLLSFWLAGTGGVYR